VPPLEFSPPPRWCRWTPRFFSFERWERSTRYSPPLPFRTVGMTLQPLILRPCLSCPSLRIIGFVRELFFFPPPFVHGAGNCLNWLTTFPEDLLAVFARSPRCLSRGTCFRLARCTGGGRIVFFGAVTVPQTAPLSNGPRNEDPSGPRFPSSPAPAVYPAFLSSLDRSAVTAAEATVPPECRILAITIGRCSWSDFARSSAFVENFSFETFQLEACPLPLFPWCLLLLSRSAHPSASPFHEFADSCPFGGLFLSDSAPSRLLLTALVFFVRPFSD